MTMPGSFDPSSTPMVLPTVPSAGLAPGAPLPPPLPTDNTQDRPLRAFPKPMLDLSEEQLEGFRTWVDTYLRELISAQQEKMTEWAQAETAYRALVGSGSGTWGATTTPNATGLPFAGASVINVPVIAMAVDPIHARLDTGIFKQDPVFKLKGLKKSILPYIPALEAWIDFNQRHRWNLRAVASPRILECAKLGSMVFKTVYDCEQYQVKTYDSAFKVVTQLQTVYEGPRVFGISLGDLLFPAGYQHLQDCPIVGERIRTTVNKLRIAEASGKITNVDAIVTQEKTVRTDLEQAREDAANHHHLATTQRDLVVYDIWCDYAFDPTKPPAKISCTYHADTREFLRLQYNHYFNQRYPHTLIPYTVSNESLYGLGICEMVKPFQDAITQWERMASDNAYIANIRMFIVQKNAAIEEVPRLYAGRCFFVENPKTDFIPFQAGDIYPSTLQERQNLFGLVEKRTGVSDYLTGRESPIIGTRATATSTLALIQEGTKRVEQVLENIRLGFAEIVQNAVNIWIQYGVGDIEDLVFGDDEIGQQVKEFFDTVVTKQNVNGAIAIDLTATDASGNRQVQQQLQLSIIQLMMGYYEKLIQAGGLAMQAMAQGAKPMADLVIATSEAARNMFRDLLQKYDIRNPDDYLPDLQQYLQEIPVGGAMQYNAQPDGGQAGGGSSAGPSGSPGGGSGLPGLPTSANGAPNGSNGPASTSGGAVAARLAGASAGY